MIETKGVEDKKNLANPVKQAAKAAAAKEGRLDKKVEGRVWTNYMFSKKRSHIEILVDKFVTRVFEGEGLDENVDCLSKFKV